METTVTELPDSRVRVDVEVPPDEIAARLKRSATALAEEVRLPGFRKGKAPTDVVIQRLGREAVLEQTIRDSLSQWYERALASARVTPVGDPSLNFGGIPATEEPLTFSIEVGVRPKAKLGSYKGLEVGKRQPEVPVAAVDEEIAKLQESFGRLEPVERSLQKGDFAVVDLVGTEKGQSVKLTEARDQLVEVGGGQLLPGFEEKLLGLKAGESCHVETEFPDGYHAEKLAGKQVSFDVTVKAVQEKKLREVDDAFASEAGGFDTVEELRQEIESRLIDAQEQAINAEFREAVVDSVVKEATITMPAELTRARAEEMWASLQHSLQEKGIGPDQYLQMAGKTEQQMIEELEPRAEGSLKRESVLEAVVEAEGVEVSDEDLERKLVPQAEGGPDGDSKKLMARLRESGRLEALRQELQMSKAAGLLVDQAVPITVEQAKAREKLWTPEKAAKEEAKDQPGSDPEKGRLWTPGQPR